MWGVQPFPSAWFALPDDDRALMLQTYIAQEQMRAVELDEQERESKRAAARKTQ